MVQQKCIWQWNSFTRHTCTHGRTDNMQFFFWHGSQNLCQTIKFSLKSSKPINTLSNAALIAENEVAGVAGTFQVPGNICVKWLFLDMVIFRTVHWSQHSLANVYVHCIFLGWVYWATIGWKQTTRPTANDNVRKIYQESALTINSLYLPQYNMATFMVILIYYRRVYQLSNFRYSWE